MPSTAEIQREFGYRSPATVTSHLSALRKNGVIEMGCGKHRSLQFTEKWKQRKTRDIPFLGSVPAGYPDNIELCTDNSIAFDSEAIGVPSSGTLFALKVSGDSMINAGIHNGDIVILEHAAEPQNGEIVAALIDGQTTLKRYVIFGDNILLRAENPKYVDMVPLQTLEVQGVLRALFRVVHA